MTFEHIHLALIEICRISLQCLLHSYPCGTVCVRMYVSVCVCVCVCVWSTLEYMYLLLVHDWIMYGPVGSTN